MKNRILDLIKKEQIRQQNTLMMIPSENYTYSAVYKAVGSFLMHKYAEGQPKKRYYQGNQVIDEIELVCKQNALLAFGLSDANWHVNVQAHSGAEANLAVYNAILDTGDKIMSMFLPDGGHLSHGWHTSDRKITLVSKIFDVSFYKVDEKTQLLNYEAIEKQANIIKPKMIISGGTAYPRQINHEYLGAIAQKVGAYYLADVSHEAGLIAARVNNSPFEYADVVTMTTHKTLRGPKGALIFCKKHLAEKIDFGVFPGLQGGPHMHSIAGVAIALEKARSVAFRKYADQVIKNAQVLAEYFIGKELNVVSGGTDKHLVLVDLRNRNTNGWIVANALEIAGIIVNRNTVPFETASPFYPSGIRLGTPAITARGMKDLQMKMIAEWIVKIIDHVKEHTMPLDSNLRSEFLVSFKNKIQKDKFLLSIRKEVENLCKNYPLPED
ncbi:MAG: serine hydroxymethyltransferase [Patescibacteria group bacterium]|nr:serine hydroxymethyltransferase [Patescibacteria group bacterium]